METILVTFIARLIVLDVETLATDIAILLSNNHSPATGSANVSSVAGTVVIDVEACANISHKAYKSAHV